MLFENHLNYLEDEFQIKKMKSYNQGANMNQAMYQGESSHKVLSTIHSNDFENQEQSSLIDNSNKKRARKAYTKKNKKIDETPSP
jgi:hypothetical protein